MPPRVEAPANSQVPRHGLYLYDLMERRDSVPRIERRAENAREGTANPTADPRATECPNGTEETRLFTRIAASEYLQLNPQQLQFLVDTNQLTQLFIVGEERFDRKDLDDLIDAYKLTFRRRKMP